ncbi:hypothetical protein F1880_007931 [Penicillium rolfsii]|nr:hypothetical protein F1880_007931 [Penicillium rolfsii]
MPDVLARKDEPNVTWSSKICSQQFECIRGWLFPNAWWHSITAGPQGAWFNSYRGIVPAYEGQFTIHGLRSQQQY